MVHRRQSSPPRVRSRHFRPLLGAATLCIGLTAVLAPTANPLGLDARQRAMGDVTFARREVSGSGRNAAFADLWRDDARVIPLPLGLVQLALAPPSFDPGDPDFSGLELLDLMLQPPVDLRLSAPPPASATTITIRAEEDLLAIDLGAAQSWIPTTSGRWGDTVVSTLWSNRRRHYQISLSPLVINQAALELSDELYAALRYGAPISSAGQYALDGMAEFTLATALGCYTTGQLGGPGREAGDPTRGWRLFGGAGFKYLVGLAYVQSTADLDLLPSEPGPNAGEPMQLQFVNRLRTVLPGTTGGPGQGFALDLDLVATRGRNDWIGLSVSNLAGRIHWRTRVEDWRLDQTSGELEQVQVIRGVTHQSDLPTIWNLSAARRWSDRGLVATDLRYGPPGLSWHLGNEARWGSVTGRSGVVITAGARPRWSAGAGLAYGRVRLDLSLYTTAAGLGDGESLYCGTSLAILPRRTDTAGED